jgi:hypothetical protein
MYQYDPDAMVEYSSKRGQNGSTRTRRPSLQTYELAAHPADLSTTTTAAQNRVSQTSGPRSVVRRAEGEELWVYQGNAKWDLSHTLLVHYLISLNTEHILSGALRWS